MSAREDGGPAFPIFLRDDETYIGPGSACGMTLHDYFAAFAPFTLADAVQAAELESAAGSVEVALCRVLMNKEKRAIAMTTLAALRIEYADAMLKERDKFNRLT